MARPFRYFDGRRRLGALAYTDPNAEPETAMSEREHLRDLAELSFEISRQMSDPKAADAARRTAIQYLADAEARRSGSPLPDAPQH